MDERTEPLFEQLVGREWTPNLAASSTPRVPCRPTQSKQADAGEEIAPVHMSAVVLAPANPDRLAKQSWL